MSEKRYALQHHFGTAPRNGQDICPAQFPRIGKQTFKRADFAVKPFRNGKGLHHTVATGANQYNE